MVFLLGGATDGAIEWAAKTLNILNVAATRARRRFYVTGDWNRWMQWPLAQMMEAPGHLERIPASEARELIGILSGLQADTDSTAPLEPADQ